MATVADTSQLPVRYRVTAATISALVHALIFLPALFWHVGGRSGQQTVNDNSAGEEIIQIEFLPAHRKISPTPSSVVDKASRQSLPVQERSRTNDGLLDSATADPRKQTASSSPGEASVVANGGGTAHKEPQPDPDSGYLSAVRAAIRREWQMNGGRDILAGCKIAIDQIEGGKALRAWPMNCGDLTALERIRLETAVMRAQLPYNGFEPQFEAHLELAL